MKICFLVPDGTGIRNYLYSRLIKELPKGTEIILWHNISENAINEVRKVHPDVKITDEKIPVYIENIKERVLREASTYARLHWNASLVKNNTILTNWNRRRANFKKKILYRVAATFGKWAQNDYQKIRKIENHYTDLINSKETLAPYTSFLKKHKPDVVFCTHQRVPWLVPAIEAAKKQKIKTVTAIYSWDNIPKARLPLRTEKYVVWSDYMKEELHKFYPEIALNDIEITGTPQFEFYSDKSRILTHEAFAKKFHLDQRKKLICYSGDDTDISPYDPYYLKDVAEVVASMDEDLRPHIIFRRSPADFTKRYDEVLEQYKNIITSIDPIWHSDHQENQWNHYYPMPDDIDLLVNLAYHCDMAINVASTIAHDFATFNKPTCYINYDQEFSNNWTVKVIYKFEHFRSMGNLSAVEWINSKADIKQIILNSLYKPAMISKDRLKWLNRIVSKDFDQSSYRIAQLLCEAES
jgi:hypothetical protein